MTIEALYASIGGSYAEAKGRLMNDRLIEKFVLKFPADPTMQALKEAVAAGDITGTFRAAHTLKGVAGNLAFSELAKKASDLTEQTRPQTAPADAVLYRQVAEAYVQVISAIEAYQREKG